MIVQYLGKNLISRADVSLLRLPEDRASQTFFAGDGPLRKRAAETVLEILSDPDVHVLPQSHESFLSGLDLYAARPDKGYSLVDCISMQTMRREGVAEVLTNDRHFEQ